MSFPGSVLLSPKDIRSQTSDKRLPLGTRGYTRDNRAFRYSKNGAVALTIGHLCQAAAENVKWSDGMNLMVAATSASTSITLHSTGSSITTANVFRDGYVVSKDAAGQGQMMQIKSHPVKATTGNCKFNLYEDSYLTASVTTGTTIFGIMRNPYMDVIVSPASAPTGIPVGVNTMAITASYYFWLQTFGPCLVETDAAVVIGSGVSADSSSAGSVLKMSTNAAVTLLHARPSIGYAMEISAGADHGIVFLTLAP